MRSVLRRGLVLVSMSALVVPAAVGSAEALPPPRSLPAEPAAAAVPTTVMAAQASQDLDPVELPQRRTAHSRTFLLPDGSYQAEIYTAPVHYREPDGDWKPIDNTLVATDRPGYAAQNAANDYRVLIPADAGSAPVRVQADGQWVSFTAVGTDGAPQVNGSTATIPGLGPNTRVEYQARNQGVKENIVLTAPPATPPSYEFDFDTSAGLVPRLRADGGIDIVDGSGQARFVVPPPFMEDSSGTEDGYSTDVVFDLAPSADGWRLTLTPDPVWLADPTRVYPVRIDPTVTLPGQPRDTWLDEAAQNNAHPGGNYVKAGRGNNLARRALLSFDLSNIPANATVSSADLQLYLDSAKTTVGDTAEYVARRMTHSWTRSATWNTSNGTDAWTDPNGGGDYAGSTAPGINLRGANSGYKTFDATSMTDKWVSGTQPNEGMLVKQKFEDVDTILSFFSANSADDSRWPKLLVTYDEPTPPAASTAGDRDYYTFVTEQLTDRMSAKVNVANGNLLVSATDTQVAGIAGLDLVLARYYNSSLATTADPARLGGGWSTGLAGSVRLEFPQGDGNRVFFHDVSGHRVRFERNAAGDFIRHAPGLDATLERPGGTGNYRLEWYSKHVWVFNPDGRLIEMRDQQGNTITFTHSQDAFGWRLDQATDTRGRTAVFSYRTDNGLLDHVDINTPDGTRLLSYAYTYSQPDPLVDPVRLATSELSYVNTAALPVTDQVNVGAETRYAYSTDADRRLVRIEDAREAHPDFDDVGGVTTIAYHPSGKVQNLTRQTTTDPVYARSTFAHSDGDTISSECNGEGESSTDVNGERTDVVDDTTYCADQHGRVVRTVDAKNNVRTSSWTANSNVATFDGSGTGTSTTPFTYTYDASDNPTQVQTPSGGTAGLEYTDTAVNPHLPTGVRDFAKGATAPTATWEYDYDDNGLLIEAFAPGPDIRYRYCWDGDGQLQRISPPNADGTNSLAKDEETGSGCGTADQGNDTILSYDADGQLTSVDRPGITQGRSYTYDALSRVKTMTDGRGIRATLTYDGLGHVVKTVYADDPAVPGIATTETITLEWEYDPAGNLIGRVDAGGASTFSVDELNRRTFEPKTHAQDPLSGVSYRYDRADNLVELEPTQQPVTTYTYDKVNLVSSVLDPRTEAKHPTTGDTRPILFGYDKRDNRTKTTYPMPDGNDLVQAAAYDDDGRMKCIYSYRQSNAPSVGDTCPAATHDGLLTFYGYDYRVGGVADGNQTNTRYRMTELGGRDTHYTYDDITRLTKATTGAASTPVREFTYTYDKRSNLTREQVNGSMAALDTRTTSIAYDDAEQMCWMLRSTSSPTTECATAPTGATDFDHDGAGSLLRGTGGELDGLNLTYNPVGQTTAIDPAGTTAPLDNMAYAGATQDIRFTAGELRYSHNLLGLSMQTTSSGGPHEETFVRDPHGTLVAMIDRTGTEPDHYYLTDGIGSTMAIVNTEGVVRRYVYEPYGEQLRNFIDEDAASPNHDLDGTGTDPKDTEADFNPYRYAAGYYDRTTGTLKYGTRYYMPTLARWTQTDPIGGQPTNPLTLNPYNYAGCNPISNADPSGRWWCGIGPVVNAWYGAGNIAKGIGVIGLSPLLGPWAPAGVGAGVAVAASGVFRGIRAITQFDKVDETGCSLGDVVFDILPSWSEGIIGILGGLP